MTSPLDRERKTLNALCFLRRQAKAFLLAVDDGLPAATLDRQRRLLHAACNVALHQEREAERALSVTPEAIDREMARARRPDQPLPSHAATMNRAGEGVTLQPGAEPQ